MTFLAVRLGRGEVWGWCQECSLRAVWGSHSWGRSGSQGTHVLAPYRVPAHTADTGELAEGRGLQRGALTKGGRLMPSHSGGAVAMLVGGIQAGTTVQKGPPPAAHPHARTWTRLQCACAAALPTGHHPHPAAPPSHRPRSARWSHTCRRETQRSGARAEDQGPRGPGARVSCDGGKGFPGIAHLYVSCSMSSKS